MSNKEEYRAFCESESAIPIFSQAWWLDAVCGESGWDVVIHKRGNAIVGSLPYVTKQKYGFRILSCPQLTQTLGIWLAKSNAKYAKMLGQQKETIENLIDQLPKYHVFTQCFSPSFTNWIPLFWAGFEQSTKYTYRINDLADLDQVWAASNANIKTDVRKAARELTIRHDLPVAEFHRVVALTYERQGMKARQTVETFQRVINAASARNACKLFFAVDDAKRTHAVSLLVWDDQAAYYLVGGADPELRKSGAGSLCVWESIKHAATVTRKFDFEGSMVEGIERFFRGFGAEQTPYFRMMRYSSPVLGAAAYLHRRFRGVI